MNKLLTLLIASILLYGCSKTNNPSPDKTANVTGKWLYKSDTLRIYNNNVLKQTHVFSLTHSPYFQFNADGSGQAMNDESGGNATSHFSYIVANNTITFSYPSQTIGGQPQDAYTQKATIKQSTTNSLVIYFDDVSSSNGVVEEDKEIVYLTK